ncbi:MAG: helix-hairpin-helix domain-containing protein [Ginsengibacter sp.]
MWRLLNHYFCFTKKERLGIIYVISIIITLIFLPILFPYFRREENIDTSEFEKEIAWLQIDSSSKKIYSNSGNHYENKFPAAEKDESVKKEALFYFDPNTISAKDWIRLGIREKTANSIQKYISKGGKFYKPEDLKKIWGLSESDANRLIPYVSIKNTERNYLHFEERKYPDNRNYSSKNSVEIIDINVADTNAFIKLPGIGSKLANRIISFREKLGGFYSVDQIGETYLLPDSTFQKIKPQLVVNSKPTKKININSASVDEMKSHPYIRFYIANAIFQFRKQHGNFQSVEEIKKIMTVTDEIYNKAFPYLTIE